MCKCRYNDFGYLYQSHQSYSKIATCILCYVDSIIFNVRNYVNALYVLHRFVLPAGLTVAFNRENEYVQFNQCVSHLDK